MQDHYKNSSQGLLLTITRLYNGIKMSNNGLDKILELNNLVAKKLTQDYGPSAAQPVLDAIASTTIDHENPRLHQISTPDAS